MSVPNRPVRDALDPDNQPPFELGAKLISLLAFPNAREVDLRRRAFEALCAQVVQEACRADPENSASWRARFPVYAAIDKAEIRRRLRTLKRRLRDRMKAAQMALGYFDEAIRGYLASIGEAYPDLKSEIGNVEVRPTPLPAGVARHSLNALARHHHTHGNEEGPHNLEERVWRASLPVIHLAVAMHVLGQHLNIGPDGFAYRLDDLGLHRNVLQLAQMHETAAVFEWNRRQQTGPRGSSAFLIDPSVLIWC